MYKEKRKVYKGKNFISLLNFKKRRDIHLGIDIFIDQGKSIYSPLDGKVIILNDNNIKYDYGPTLVLEHIYKKHKFILFMGICRVLLKP